MSRLVILAAPVFEILCGKTDRFHLRPDHHCRLLQTFAKNVPFHSTLVHSAH